MKRPRILHSLLVLAALGTGFLSGLPFRSAPAMIATPSEPASSARMRDPFGKEIPRPPTAAERALEILTTGDPSVLQRAFERLVPKALAGSDGDLATVWEIAARWAGIDPRGMFDHLMAHGGLSRETHQEDHLVGFGRVLFQAWIKADPEAAIAAALEMDQHPRYPGDDGLENVIPYLIAHDPERARQLGAEHPTPVLEALGDRLSEAPDKNAYLDFLVALRPSPRQEQRLREALLKWTSDPDQHGDAWPWLRAHPEALGLLAQHPYAGPDGARLPVDLLAAMRDHVTGHPETAETFVRSRGADLIEIYGFPDAFSWASDKLKGEARHHALRFLFEASAEVGIDDVRAAYATLPTGPLRDETAAHLAGRSAVNDPGETLDWIDTQELTKAARVRAIDHWAMEIAAAPPGPIAFLNSRPPDADSEALLTKFFHPAAGFNPPAGLPYALELTDDEQAASAARLLFSGWPQHEGIDAARTAANAIERPAVRQAALETLDALEANGGFP